MILLEIIINTFIITFSVVWFIVRPMLVLVFGLIGRNKQKEGPIPKLEGVSIIVPCHNEAETIEKSVISFLNQELDCPLEVLLIENNSTDNTYEVIQSISKKYPQVTALSKTTPKGLNPISYSLNYGIEHCKYDIVVRIDADTELVSDSIAKAIKPLIENEGVVTTATNVRISNLKDNMLTRLQGIDYYFSMELDRRSQRLYNGVLCCSGAMQVFRLDDLKSLGGYNTSKDIGEDMEITFRLHGKGKVEMTPEAVSFTDSPNTLKSLIHQRLWWMRIGIVTTYLHKRMIGRKYGRKGMMGIVALPIKVLTTFQAFIGIFLKVIGALVLSSEFTFLEFVNQFLWLSIIHVALDLFSFLVIIPVAYNKQGVGQWYLVPLYSLIYQPFLAAVRTVAIIQGLILISKVRKTKISIPITKNTSA